MLHLSGGPKLLPLAFLFKSSLPIIDTYIGEKLCQNLRSREDLEMRNAGTYPKSSPIPVLYQVADHLGKGHGALGHDLHLRRVRSVREQREPEHQELRQEQPRR